MATGKRRAPSNCGTSALHSQRGLAQLWLRPTHQSLALSHTLRLCRYSPSLSAPSSARFQRRGKQVRSVASSNRESHRDTLPCPRLLEGITSSRKLCRLGPLKVLERLPSSLNPTEQARASSSRPRLPLDQRLFVGIISPMTFYRSF